MQPIETSYAGCRFRSRLEARWAVFFDSIGIVWHYEHQGYELEHRLSNTPGTYRYLPDFWLPGLNAYFEAKGQLDSDADLLRMLDCAAAISAPLGGCGEGPNVIVGGEIPTPGSGIHPVSLHMHKGDLIATTMPGSGHCHDGLTIARDYGGSLDDVCAIDPDLVRRLLLVGGFLGPVARFDAGYTAARSARFDRSPVPA